MIPPWFILLLGTTTLVVELELKPGEEYHVEILSKWRPFDVTFNLTGNGYLKVNETIKPSYGVITNKQLELKEWAVFLNSTMNETIHVSRYSNENYYIIGGTEATNKIHGTISLFSWNDAMHEIGYILLYFSVIAAVALVVYMFISAVREKDFYSENNSHKD